MRTLSRYCPSQAGFLRFPKPLRRVMDNSSHSLAFHEWAILAGMIVSSDAVRAWEAGNELVATGRGANNPAEDAEL